MLINIISILNIRLIEYLFNWFLEYWNDLFMNRYVCSEKFSWIWNNSNFIHEKSQTFHNKINQTQKNSKIDVLFLPMW